MKATPTGSERHVRARRGACSAPAIVLTALLATGATAADTKAPHGALAMDAQQARFDQLVPRGADPALPAGIDPVVWKAIVPADNQMNADRVALGRRLFFDMRLSADGTVACATCHDVSRGFTDQRAVSEGIRDQLGRRNAPTTLNALLMQAQFLDGRAATLEEQAKLPIVNPIEMGMKSGEQAVAALAGDAEYQQLFQKAYGRAPNYEDIGRAIAAFERTMIFMDAPFDDFLRGDTGAISAEARKGWELFNGEARCVSCHWLNPSSPIGSDNRFHNIGVAARHQDFEQLAKKAADALQKDDSAQAIDELALGTDLSELGRFMITRSRGDIGAFKTSQLRNVGITPPYMHDGSLQTLWDVMDHYNKGGEANPFLDGGIEPLALSESDIDALVAFMFTLTDERFADQNRDEQARQRALARKQRPFRDTALANRETFPFEARVFGTGKE